MKLPQASLTESCADDRIGPMAVQVFDDPGVQTEQVEELDDPGSGHAQDSGYLRFRSDAGMRQLGEAASSLIQGGDSRQRSLPALQLALGGGPASGKVSRADSPPPTDVAAFPKEVVGFVQVDCPDTVLGGQWLRFAYSVAVGEPIVRRRRTSGGRAGREACPPKRQSWRARRRESCPGSHSLLSAYAATDWLT
jgi:hypothetical protein